MEVVDVDRNTGIDFGCDISLNWPYVMRLDPDGSALRTGMVQVGDQLVAVAGESVIGLPIGNVMERLGAADGASVQLIFFRGSREELQQAVGIAIDSDDGSQVSITVQRPGLPDEVLPAPRRADPRPCCRAEP